MSMGEDCWQFWDEGNNGFRVGDEWVRQNSVAKLLQGLVEARVSR